MARWRRKPKTNGNTAPIRAILVGEQGSGVVLDKTHLAVVQRIVEVTNDGRMRWWMNTSWTPEHAVPIVEFVGSWTKYTVTLRRDSLCVENLWFNLPSEVASGLRTMIHQSLARAQQGTLEKFLEETEEAT